MLQQNISEELKQAMKSKEADKVSVLRMINAALLNYSVAKMKKGEPLSDEEVIAVISREIKQRKDSIAEYEKGGRPELADKEKIELDILQKYMPEQMGEEEIKKVVQEILSSGITDAGKVMGQVMGKLKGKADGTVVRKVVEELLK